MKLIDLLVQKLPKRGGWPDGAVECCRHYGTNSIDFYDETGNWDDDCYLKYGKDFAKGCIYEETSGSHRLQSISRSEYEAALSASKKPAWNGEDIPPVGCECESKQFSQVDWAKFKVVAVCDGHVFGFWGNGVSTALDSKMWEFRPLRTEAERKRDSAVEAVLKTLNYYDFEMVHIRGDQKQVATEIIDAIAAGKIPGVKLED